MRERGSVLMLMPAAVLILLILGAIAVDAAVVHLGQRQLANAVAAAANDAAGAALSDAAFYGDGRLTVDPARARSVAGISFAAAFPPSRSGAVTPAGPPSVSVSGDQVCVAAEARVRHIFARAIPGVAHSTVVRARSAATAVRGSAATAPAAC